MRKIFKRNQKRAQGMTEYIIIVGLIAILLIAAVGAFKDSVKGAFDAGTKEIGEKVTKPINDGN